MSKARDLALRTALQMARAGAIGVVRAIDEALALVSPTVQSKRPNGQSNYQSNRTVQQSNSSFGLSLDSLSSSDLSPSSLNVSENIQTEERESSERAREAGLSESDSGLKQVGLKAGQHLTAAALANCWDGIGGMGCNGDTRALLLERLPLIERLAAERGVEPLALLKRACDRFKADPAIAGKRLKTVRVLMGQLENWVDDAPAKSGPAPAIVPPSRKLFGVAAERAKQGGTQ